MLNHKGLVEDHLGQVISQPCC